MSDLLIELFSEEIPARMQGTARESLKKLVTDGLVEAGLTYESAGAFSTPRRLVLTLTGLSPESRAVREERKGPRTDAPAAALEGFLRSTRSLIQTFGRAARNVEGRVILYADKITNSMHEAMGETSRRRARQEAHNLEHGIVPKTIHKEMDNVLDAIYAQATGMRHGPCRLMDAVGLDVVLSIEEHYAQKRPGLPEEPRTLLRQLVADGHLGLKSGRGLYDDYKH